MPRDSDFLKKTRHPDVHNARGIELAQRGWLEEAKNEFNKAIALDKHCAYAYDNLANVQAEQGDLLGAMKAYQHALEIDATNPTTYFNLACFLANHANELSLELYKTTARIDAEFPDVYLNIGISLREAGKYEEAAHAFRRALKVDAHDAEARFGLAHTLMELGEHASAVTEWKRGLLEDKTSLFAWANLGLCYIHKGFYSEAERSLVSALSHDENDVMAIYYLAAVKALRNEIAECLELLRRGLRLDRLQIKKWLENDKFFSNVSNLSEFRELIASF